MKAASGNDAAKLLFNPKEQVKIHITYDKELTLKELSEVILSVQQALNTINRESGIKNNAILGREYASIVSGVESGSIVLAVVLNIAIPVACSLVANCIYDRVKSIGVGGKKKDETAKGKYPIAVSVEGDSNSINIHIQNGQLSDAE